MVHHQPRLAAVALKVYFLAVKEFKDCRGYTWMDKRYEEQRGFDAPCLEHGALVGHGEVFPVLGARVIHSRLEVPQPLLQRVCCGVLHPQQEHANPAEQPEEKGDAHREGAGREQLPVEATRGSEGALVVHVVTEVPKDATRGGEEVDGEPREAEPGGYIEHRPGEVEGKDAVDEAGHLNVPPGDAHDPPSPRAHVVKVCDGAL
mmetsp:Transcript_11128/g.35305  ORF Transcript_11128/g.35305 Transcript_11128/m.35305 type:complete len:204 (+) Transcript_11128:1485-2096(+)